jgi:hypothetical protein
MDFALTVAIFVFCLIWLGLQIEAYFEWSCRSMEWAWRVLLGAFGVILCNVNVGEFGVQALELDCVACTCTYGLPICNFCLLLRVASWNLGWGCGWVQAHYYCKWAKSFETGVQLP